MQPVSHQPGGITMVLTTNWRARDAIHRAAWLGPEARIGTAVIASIVSTVVGRVVVAVAVIAAALIDWLTSTDRIRIAVRVIAAVEAAKWATGAVSALILTSATIPASATSVSTSGGQLGPENVGRD